MHLPHHLHFGSLTALVAVITLAGCASSTPKWIEQPWTPIDGGSTRTLQYDDDGESTLERFGAAKEEDQAKDPVFVARRPDTLLETRAASRMSEKSGSDEQPVVRGQDPGYGSQPAGYSHQQEGEYPLNGQSGSYSPPAGHSTAGQANGSGTRNYPVYTPPQQTIGPAPVAGPNTSTSNQVPGYFESVPPVGNSYGAPNYADLDVLLREAQTGRMTFGAAYNSNSGLVGQIIIDERNFDILNFPRSFQDIVNGTAWRGRGQGFRLELVPGNEVQRYLVNFSEPYLFNSQVSFQLSGYFFDRRYLDWDEQRLGGRFSFGYRLTPDLSLSAGLRMENVNIHDPRVATSPSLNAVLGDSSLYLAQFSLVNDTRDHPFMASSGSYLEMSYYQGFGDFDYPRGEVDYRRYFLLYQRPDQSGRHTLSVGTKLGFSGAATPLYENYFAGGFSTLRGFDFRGASPVEGGVRAGGRFQWLNTVEYTFPITADDMFKGVLFCDFGTVEREIELDSDNFRVAPGFGFRVHMPIGGAGGAPLAFDFAFPVEEAATDDKQVFSFYMSAIR